MATANQSFAIFKAAIYIWHLPLSYALVCAFNTSEIKRGYSKHNMYKAYEIQLELRLYRVHTTITITAVVTVLLFGLYSTEELRVYIMHFICSPHFAIFFVCWSFSGFQLYGQYPVYQFIN